MTNKTFCIYPFMQSVVQTHSGVGPCCLIQNLSGKKQTISEAWNDPAWKSLQTRMLDDHADVPECAECVTNENQFGSSMRTTTLKDYKFLSPEHYEKLLDHHQWRDLSFPRRVELHVSNLCNLKCLTCRPEDSSSFLTENRVIGISQHQQKDYEVDVNTINEVKQALADGNVDLLDLRGGESMMVPEIYHMLDSLPKHVYHKTLLRIQTNCTVLSLEWKQLLLKFAQCEVMMSIDAVEHYNTYIRYPSRWSDIVSAVDWITQQHCIKSYVNCTVSNLNIHVLPSLLEWCRERKIYIYLYPVNYPEMFQFQNLPATLLHWAQQRLIPYRTWNDKLDGIISAPPLNNDDLWKQFCQTVSLRDQHRRNSIFEICPSMKDHWIV
jgi:MoaA/NifB/PqqE/SkfB family radical SAM enzyme